MGNPLTWYGRLVTRLRTFPTLRRMAARSREAIAFVGNTGTPRSTVAEVLEVRISPDDRIPHLAIDNPYPRARRAGHDLEVSGWAVGKAGGIRAVNVTHRGTLLESIPVGVVRPDVGTRYSSLPWARKSGFSSLIPLVGLPPDFQIELDAVTNEQSVVPIATLEGRRLLVESGYEPALRPLMVTSLGRTGTTLLMRVLLQHPAVIGRREHPYETRVARYWLHAFSVLSAPANHRSSATPDDFAANPHRVGHNPFYIGALARSETGGWFPRDNVEHLAAFTQQTIDSFYRNLADRHGRRGARFFAEKQLPDRTPAIVWELYPNGREIVLVRDPRDMVASMLAFNRKREREMFGADSAASNEDFILQMRTRFLKLTRALQERQHKAVLVLYEDLVSNPELAVAQLLERLNLGGRVSAARVVRAAFAQDKHLDHRTSEHPQDSIGRWRRDLSDSEQAACAEAFDDLVEEFGYARA